MKERTSQLQLGIEVVLLSALCFFFFFYGLAAFGLVGADEPRYAQVAREMFERHDWVTPTLYGNVWLEKPVLYYWGAIFSYKLFGVSDCAARLPGAVFGTATIVFLFFWTRRFRPGSQLDATVITASMAFVFAFARAASMDIQLVAPLTMGLLCWWGFYETNKRGWLLAAYAAVAVGMLAKGPVSPALAVLVIVAFVAIRREWNVLIRTLWIPGILVFLFIALPWYVAVQHANPGFFREFFLQHNLDRFATNRFQHKQHFWYYVPVLLAGTLPWTWFVVLALVRGLRSVRVARAQALLIFLTLWVLVPFVFFSFSQSKLPGYLLPSIVPCGLLVAIYLQLREEEDRPSVLVTALHGLLSGAVLAAAVIAPYRLYRMPIPRAILTMVIPMALIVALAVATVVFTRGYRAIRIATLVPVALALAFLLRAAGPVIDATQSTRPIATRILDSYASREPVLFFHVPRQIEYGLAFYLDRPLPEAPPDEIVKFGGAGSTNVSREKTLKDVSGGFPPSHGNYVIVMRTGEIDRFAANVPPNFQVEPFFRFPPQRLDVYHVREVGPPN